MAMKFRRYVRGALLTICMMMTLVPATVRALEANACEVSTADAFNQAVADDACTLIRLTDSMDLTNLGVLDISNKTIDLNTHTISAENWTLLFQGTNAVLRNGAFDSKGGSYALFIGDTGVTDGFVVEDVVTTGGINIFNASNVVLRDVNVTGTDFYAIWCDEGGQVTIESGTFKTNGNAVLGMMINGSQMQIQGGNFEKESHDLVLTGNQWGKPEISGGVFDAPVAEEYCADGFEPVLNANGTYGVAIVVDAIVVNSTAHKTEYWVGDPLDVTGLTIEASKSDGTSETVAVTEDMISGFDSSAAATVSLTITYEEKTTALEVTVKERPRVTGITVNSNPHKTTYQVGDKLNVTGLTIEATKSDGTSETVAVTKDMISGFDSRKEGTNTLTISYQGVTVELAIEIKAAPKKPSANVPTADTDAQGMFWMMGLAALGMLTWLLSQNKIEKA